VKVNLNLANTLLRLGDIKQAKAIVSSRENINAAKAIGKAKDFALLTAAVSFYEGASAAFIEKLNRARESFGKEPTYGHIGGALAFRTPPLDQMLLAFSLQKEGKIKKAEALLRRILPEEKSSTDTPNGSKMKDETAEQSTPALSLPNRYELIYYDTPVALTWFDITQECEEEKGIAINWKNIDLCIPGTAQERINQVLGMYQDRLALTLYYRVNEYFGGLLCPYVYSREAAGGEWEFETSILVNFHSKGLKKTQTKTLKKFSGEVMISEREPETSYIDKVSIIAKYEDGSKIELLPKDNKLKRVDGASLVLKRGESQIIKFFIPTSNAKAIAFDLMATGYYIREKR
jgi:hypothetical protein